MERLRWKRFGTPSTRRLGNAEFNEVWAPSTRRFGKAELEVVGAPSTGRLGKVELVGHTIDEKIWKA